MATSHLHEINIVNGSQTDTYLIEPKLYANAEIEGNNTYYTVDIPNFELTDKVQISLKLPSANGIAICTDPTATSPTIIPIYYNGEAITSGLLSAGKVYSFVYDAPPNEVNPRWHVIGELTPALSQITGAEDLQAIEGLSGTSGLLKKTGNNTWTLDTANYVTSSGVTSIIIKTSSPLSGGSDTATTTTGEYTIGFSNQNKNVVLAGPSSGDTAAAPTFRALVAADIPDISGTYLPLAGGAMTGTAALKLKQLSGSTTLLTNKMLTWTNSSGTELAYIGVSPGAYHIGLVSKGNVYFMPGANSAYPSNTNKTVVVTQSDMSPNSAGTNIALGTSANRWGTIYSSGILSLQPASGEGGEIHLSASAANTTQAGIVLDQQSSKFRIFGIASADGTTKTGTGTPLVIDPYGKTITGGYTITGTLSGNATTATSWANARTLYVALGTASKTVTINGDAANAAAVAVGVDGTLGIANGGTGKTSASEAWTALGGGASGRHADSYFVQSVNSTDNAIVRFNGEAGQVQNSTSTIDDNGNLSVAGTINNYDIRTGGTFNADDKRTINGFWTSNAAITNAPTTNHGSFLSITSLGTPFQLFLPDASFYIYKRYYSSSKWNSWTKLYAGYADSADKATNDADGNAIKTTYAKLASPALTGTPTAPTAANGTSTTQIATTEFVNNTLAYINAMQFKGTIGTGGTVTALPDTHEAGDTYRVKTAGSYPIVDSNGRYCEIGTLIICVADGTTANAADWTAVETNEDGSVISSSTSTTDNTIARWDSTSGRIIQSSNVVVDDTGNISTTLATATSIGYSVTNSQAKIMLYSAASGNHGLHEGSNWIIYQNSTKANTYVFNWKNKGSSTKLVYFTADGEPAEGEYVLPVYYSNLDLTATKPAPGAYSLNIESHPVTTKHEYGSAISLPNRNATDNGYAAQLLITSESGETSDVHAYIRRVTSTPIWSNWSTLLDNKNTTAPSSTPTLSWGADSTVFTLNGTEVKIKAMAKPSPADIGAASSDHTHTLSIAEDTGTNNVTLGYGKKYKLTAGGSTYIFTMPASDNTNTATAADDILHGSHSGTEIKYAPYTSQQSKLSFDTSTTAPTDTTRINLNGYLYTTNLAVIGDTTIGTTSSGALGIKQTNGIGLGLSLYGGPKASGSLEYGIMFAQTTTFGGCGSVTEGGKWATYFTMNRNDARGWIFKSNGGAKDKNNNVASIAGNGDIYTIGTVTIKDTTAGSLTVDGNNAVTASAGSLETYGGIATRGASFFYKTVSIAGRAADNPLIVRGISGCASSGLRGSTLGEDQALYLNYNGGPVYIGYTETTADADNQAIIAYISDSSDSTSGALTVAGGAGIAKNLYVGNRITAKEINATQPMVLSAGKIYSNITSSNVLLPAKTTMLFSNGIAIANPGLTAANDVGWIRCTGRTESNTVLEIATGDDGVEQIVARQYNTSSQIVAELILLDNTTDHKSVFRSIVPDSNDTYNLGASDNKWANIYATTFTGNLSGNATSASKLSMTAITSLGSFRTDSDKYLMYTCYGGSNNIQDKPTDVNAFGCISFKNADGYQGQILQSNTGTLYHRAAANTSLNGTSWSTILDSANTYASDANENDISVSWNTSTTIATINGIDVKIKIPSKPTYSDISAASSTHTHGNLTNDGKITTGITLAKDDYLIVGDNSDGGKIGKGPVLVATISSQTTSTKFLRQDGTWAAPSYIANAAYGNVNTSGQIGQTSGWSLASGDGLVVFDSSNSNKLERTGITFDASTETKCLTQKGTWAGFLPIGGGTLTGNLLFKNSSIDASKANNNVSSTQYPTTFCILDTGDRIITRLESVVESGGNISGYWYVRNYNTSGTQVAQKGIKMTMAKDGTFTYTVSDAAKFRSAISAAESSHTHSYLPLSGGTLTGQLIIEKSSAGAIYLKRGTDPNWIQAPTSSSISFCVNDTLAGANGSFRIRSTTIDSYNNNSVDLGNSSTQWKSVHSYKYIIEEKVTLEWNSTDQSLDFIFA